MRSKVFTIELWKTAIDAQVYGKAFQPDTLVLDGIPRNLRQAQPMEGLIEVRRAFHVFCSDREKLIQTQNHAYCAF